MHYELHLNSLLTDGTDFKGGVFMVTFAPGDIEASANISIVDDGVLEGLEMFNALLFTNDPNVDISSDDTASITIVDDGSWFCKGTCCLLLLLIFYNVQELVLDLIPQCTLSLRE